MTSMSFCLSLKPCSNSCFSGGLPSAHFGKQLHRAELVWEFDLAALRVVELRQAVIGGNFSDGRLQNLHQVLNCLIPCSWHFSAFRAQQAEQEGIELRDRIRAAYPFHPALIDLMRERWAAIPDFHRTREALRFLATCLRSANTQGKSRALLGPCDVPIHDPQVRLGFSRRSGSSRISSRALSMTLSAQTLVPAGLTNVVRRSFPEKQ
jgi:hypothetical protein